MHEWKSNLKVQKLVLHPTAKIQTHTMYKWSYNNGPEMSITDHRHSHFQYSLIYIYIYTRRNILTSSSSKWWQVPTSLLYYFGLFLKHYFSIEFIFFLSLRDLFDVIITEKLINVCQLILSLDITNTCLTSFNHSFCVLVEL